MSDFTDNDDDEDGSSGGDFPPVAAVALAVSLTAVLVIVFVIVWRGRKSRRRPEASRLLYAPGPQKPRIWDRLGVQCSQLRLSFSDIRLSLGGHVDNPVLIIFGCSNVNLQ